MIDSITVAPNGVNDIGLMYFSKDIALFLVNGIMLAVFHSTRTAPFP